jgi:hypothetical protein
MLAKYNNLPLNKLVTSHVIVTKHIKLKTLSTLAVSLYPPVGTCYAFKWEMGLLQGLEDMVSFIERKAMEIFLTKS